MYIRPHGAKDYVKGNKQSCSDLVSYLSKENEGVLLTEQEYFFNTNGSYYQELEVTESIDKNVKGLHTKDTKFFMLTINPSEWELKHLARMAGGREIESVRELNKEEFSRYQGYIKDYTNNVMELYAAGFNKGLTANDILYYAKVEQQRTYNFHDDYLSKRVETLKNDGKPLKAIVSELSNERARDVRFYYENGRVREGAPKPGLQTHVHIVVSRRDREMKVSISPLANARGNKANIFGKDIRVGLDRDKFIQQSETLFDQQFGYERSYQEYYAYRKSEQQTVRISETQIHHFLKSGTKIQGIQEQETGEREIQKGYSMAKNLYHQNPTRIVQQVLKMGEYDNLHKGALGQMNHGEFLRFIANIAKGNPVSIAREVMQGIQNTISHEL